MARRLLVCALLVAAGIPATAARPPAALPLVGYRTFILPGHGSLEVVAPIAWKESIQWSADGLVPTIEFTPAEGRDFFLQIKPTWDSAAREGIERSETMRSMVEDLCRRHPDDPARPAPNLREIRGSSSAGYACVLEDQAAHTGGWIYVTKGAIGTGDILLSFTLLTNGLASLAWEDALQLIESSRHVLVEAERKIGAASAGATLRKLTYPGKRWGLVLDLPGFTFEERTTRDDMTGIGVFGTNETTKVMISVFLERAKSQGDARTCREFYWKKIKRGVPGGRKLDDVHLWERGDMALVDYQVRSFRGVEINQKSVNALLAHDGVWVDVHLSKVQYGPQDQGLFDAILNSIRILGPDAIGDRGAPTGAAAPRPSSIQSLPVPGRSWSVVLDTLGAVLAPTPRYGFEEKDRQVTRQQVVGTHSAGGSEPTGFIFDVTIGGDPPDGDARAMRGKAWRTMQSARMGRMTDVLLSEHGELAMVEFEMRKVVGEKVDIKSAYGFLSHDGVAIVIIVSKVDYRPQDAALFRAVLESVRIATPGEVSGRSPGQISVAP